MPHTPAIFDAIGQSMKHLGTRQRILSQNIANADTPGYKARDAAEQNFASLLGEGGQVAVPKVQISDQMRALGTRSLTAGTIPATDIFETKPDGNNVTLEDQLLKMGQVQADFAALTSLYRKQISLVKAALGKGGSG
jgi:flagellar basal-body rod protein FlgB